MLWALELLWIAKPKFFLHAFYVIDAVAGTNRAYNLLPRVDIIMAIKTFNLN